MKIVKPSDESKKITGVLLTPGPDPKALAKGKSEYLEEESKMCVKIDHATDADTLHKNGFHDWMRIDKNLIEGAFGKNHHAFETFIQGYILYFEEHDSVVGKEDRFIYFDWNPNSKYDLIIYLKPLYVRNFDYDHPMSKFPFSNPPTVVDPPPIKKIPPPSTT